MKIVNTRSLFEARICKKLQAQGVDFGYETEVLKFTPRPKQRKYTPDVVLTKKDGDPLYIEIKGYFKTADRQKHLSIRECNPEADIRFVFQNPDNKIYKNSKTTYGEWASKHGFQWAAGEIPEEWLHE